MKLNKKGALGLSTVGAVMLALMTIAVIAIAAFLAISNLRDAAEDAETLRTGSVFNETLSALSNSSGNNLNYYYLRNVLCTLSYVANASNGSQDMAGNYTQSNCRITAVAGEWIEGEDLNVTYTYTYNSPEVNEISANITSGPIKLFKQAPTFFVLLGVVVLILIISIVIYAVSKFSEGGLSVPGKGSGGMSEKF